MKRIIYRLLVIALLCGVAVIGFTGETSNRDLEDAGQFDPATGWVGNQERGYDVNGPLEADAYRAAYTDNNNNVDIVRSNSAVYSYSVDLMFTGTYWVSASVWIQGFGPSAHPGTFQGSTYDSESQSASFAKGAGPIPGFPDITFASSWAWITGFRPPVPPVPGGGGDSGSGDDGDGNGGGPVQHSAYAHVPF